MATRQKPLVLITGASGRIGGKLIERLKSDYRLVGLDLEARSEPIRIFACDLTSDESVGSVPGQGRSEPSIATSLLLNGAGCR